MITVGYKPYLECSTKGDKRFSSFCAYVNGKSIEYQYQAFKIFEDGSTNLSWREAKGRKPVNINECVEFYNKLWKCYIDNNPLLLIPLVNASGLSDAFGVENKLCNQIKVLWSIRNNVIADVIEGIKNNNSDVIEFAKILSNDDYIEYDNFSDDFLSINKKVPMFIVKYYNYYDPKLFKHDIFSCCNCDYIF